MAGWTGHETAIWFAGSVQHAQDMLDFKPRDGKYGAALHRALRTALIAAGLRDQADKLDDKGPAGITLWPGFDTQGLAEDLAVAWAWWAKLRGKAPYPSAMEPTILAKNEELTANGDKPLTARDAEEFVGDAPPLGASTRVWWIVGGIMAAAVVATVGVSYGRQSCPAPLPATKKRVARKGGR